MNYYHNATRGAYAAPVLADQSPGAGWFPVISTNAPDYNSATQAAVAGGLVFDAQTQTFSRTWSIVPLTQLALDTAANQAERQAVKALIGQITQDITDSQTDQANAQAYIDIISPTAQQRNDEVLNSAKRDKSNEQRYRRIARIIKQLQRDVL